MKPATSARSAPRFPPPQAGRWLYAGIALVIAPHVMHLPVWLSGLAFCAIGWRWLADNKRLPLPGKWLLGLLILAAGSGVLLHYHTLLGRDAGVALLTMMLALKMLEARTYRDAMLSVFLGYFVVITIFFYTQSIPVALYLFGVVLTLTVALILFNHRTAIAWRIPVRHVAMMMVQAVPLMLLLFVLYPRIPGPLWGLPDDAFSGTSGLSDEISPGSISRLVQSDEIAFRAKFSNGVPANPELYWRAIVMDRFDGRTWRTSGKLPPYTGNSVGAGPMVRYALTIEPHDKHWLFALETPDSHTLPNATRLTEDMRLLADNPVRQRLRIQLASRLGATRDAPFDQSEQARTLQLPGNINPRTRALAAQLKSQTSEPEDIARRALDLIREQPFVYTLTPPPLGENAVDEFLFVTRSGFCEHYAGAFTFLMRAAGVPARIVAGYQGGEYNHTGGYLIVRQSDAHAWSEIWVNGKGWIRIDPTFAVAAERIENGISSALRAGEPLPFLVRSNLAWLKALRQQWDTVNNQWNQWILNYDQERQLSLFSQLGFGILSWQQLIWALAIGMALLMAVLAVIVFRNVRTQIDPALRLYLKYCTRLARAGLPRNDNEGPQDYAHRIIHAHPQLATSVNTITQLYIRLRYAQPGSEQQAQLSKLAAQVKQIDLRGIKRVSAKGQSGR